MTRPSSSNEQPIAAGQVPEGASQGGCSGGQESPVPAASSPFANSERPSEKLREGLSLSERLRSWAQNEEMIDAHYTAHGRDCNEAAIALSATQRSGWTPAEAKRLLAFQHEHCTNDHDAAYHEIYWLVSDRAADPYHPWAEVEALAAADKSGT